MKNPQTGMMIELPRTKVAALSVISFSGTGNNEVSICAISSGSLSRITNKDVIVQEL